MAQERGRWPDYRVHAMNKATDEKSKVGAGWSNQDGSIAIRLDPFVVLTAGRDLVITMFPVSEEDKKNDRR